jgi:exopolysaccharide biosynthesis polyprenyl glycosylphosphotransferase
MSTRSKSGSLPIRPRSAGRPRVVTSGIDRWVVSVAVIVLVGLFTWRHHTAYALSMELVLVAAVILALAIRASTRTGAETVVILGHGSLANILTALLTEAPHRFPFLGRGSPTLKYRHTASVGEAEELLRTTQCDWVIIADPTYSAALSTAARSLVDRDGCSAAVIDGVDVLERALGRVPLDFATEDAWATRHAGSLREVAYLGTKRVMDVVLAIAIGIAILPLLPLIALAIKLDSGGSILYHQDRVGLGGRIFRIHKFRTMHADAERNGAVWAQVNDPRVTRLGRFFRRTRIDELPQVWNVIRGEMSFVGPRPERPQFTKLLEQEIHCYHLRNLVRPGLTGWAQVRFRYTNSLHDSRMKLEYDLYYLKNASLLFDLRILLRTVFVVLGKKGM